MRIEVLTREAFAPFGEVIELTGAEHYPINSGSTERYHALAHIETDAAGAAILSVFRAEPRPLPFTLQEMEYHPLGSQAFYPLSGRPYIVVVAQRGEPPRVDDLRIFLARADQGVNYAPHVWHHPLLALFDVSDFLIADRQGPGNNCVVHPLPPNAILTLEAIRAAIDSLS